MSDPLDDLRRRHRELSDLLDDRDTGADAEGRERVRAGIVSLFRDTERLIEELGEFKGRIRPLVDRYKAQYRTAPAPESERRSPSDSAGSVRVDHLGSSTYLERGWNSIAAGAYERAADELRKALDLAPAHPRGEALLGWALMRLGRLPEARDVLERLLSRDPDNDLARTNLGYVCLCEDRIAEAVEHLSRAARSDDRTAALYAHLYLGMLHGDRERHRESEGALKRALEIGPNLIEAYWQLGRVHYRQGRTDLAREVWRRGAERNGFDPWGERCGEAADRLDAGDPVSLD